MAFNIIVTEPFERKFKKLHKKYSSLSNDLNILLEMLESTPDLGSPLGKNCFKIRMPISSKNKGKSAGARVITFLKKVDEVIYLIDIYDKSDKDSLTDKELKILIDYILE